MEIALLVVGGVFALLLASYVLKHVIWMFNPLFFLLDKLIWFFYNPARFILKNKDRATANYLYRLSMITLVAPVYWLVAHILLTPFRFITSLYFDVLVYWSVMLDDTLKELFMPMMGKIRHKKGFSYLIHWIVTFPYRIVVFVLKTFFTLLDTVFMNSVSIVLPTFTMYHGTNFESAISNIAQRGKWKVGSGAFAGLGLYFTPSRKTAFHYARHSDDKAGAIVVRITPTFTRNGATLPKDLRNEIGHDGKALSHNLPFPWKTIEHWRDDHGGWWEYCLVHKGEVNDFVSSWRVRPVAFLDHESKLKRLWNGQSHYSLTIGGAFAGVATMVVFMFISSLLESL